MATVSTDVEKILCHVRSGAPYVWVQTSEYDYCIEDILKGLKTWIDVVPSVKTLKAYRWDVAGGMKTLSSGQDQSTGASGVFEAAYSPNGGTSNEEFVEDYPVREIQNIAKPELKKSLEDRDTQTVVFVLDYHKFIDDVRIWRQMQNNYHIMTDCRITMVIISPTISIPNEIKDYVIAVDYPYPGVDFIREAIESEAKENGVPMDDIDVLVNAAQGLSRTELFQGIYSSIADAEDSGIHARYITAIKEARLAKDSAIKILPSTEGFDSLVGMERLKTFSKKMILSGKGRGVLLLGVPGTGKSAFAATLGKETNRTTLSLDFSTLMGGIVGETEEKTAYAIKIIDSMQPCVLFIDEIEKGLAGVSGYNGDSGTSRRQGSLFLKWLSDHNSDVFVIATANSISDLPPEFKRAERWDAIFFLDVPKENQARAILEYYAGKYGISERPEETSIEDLTGAEIKSMCRLANAQDIMLSEARQFVVPIVQSFDVEALRAVARKCAIPSEADIPVEAPKPVALTSGNRRPVAHKTTRGDENNEP